MHDPIRWLSVLKPPKKEEPADENPVGQQAKPIEEPDDTMTTEEESTPSGSRK